MSPLTPGSSWYDHFWCLAIDFSSAAFKRAMTRVNAVNPVQLNLQFCTRKEIQTKISFFFKEILPLPPSTRI